MRTMLRASFTTLMLALALAASPAAGGQRSRSAGEPRAPKGATSPDAACRLCIRAHEGFLASDVLRGRGSGTGDELIAATYIATELEAYGILPAAGNGHYIETAPAPAKPIKPGQDPGPAPSPQLGTTVNVVGVLPGADPGAKVLLLSAHLDHLGVQPRRAFHGDTIFNGANDDASGCTAVLEMARMLALGPRPRRTVYFAFFGSEESGGYGARYFVAHPPVPLARVFANLEFEMIGWPDPLLPPHTLWLTGWRRSTLGPDLVRAGAQLVPDPHPQQHFFCRSDNIQLAELGVVAQTISSFGMQPMYHRADDDLAHLDIDLMTNSISSLIGPIRQLLNSSFVAHWRPGGQPDPSRPCAPMRRP